MASPYDHHEMKLTRTNVKSLKPASKFVDERDDSLKGFIARISPSSKITYFFQYKSPVSGKQVNYWLGVEGTINVTQARDAAEMAAGKVALGRCVHLERQRDRKAAKKKVMRTFGTANLF